MNQNSFQYIKTYTGFRGKIFTEQVNQSKSEINDLEKLLKSNINFKERYSIKQKIKRLKTSLDIYNIRLINTQNNIHQFAREIATIKKDTNTAKRLISIFNSRVEEPFITTACPPIYRDAIVFFNENRIIKIIHCCFECINIINENNTPISLTQKSFKELKQVLTSIGHKID